MLAILISLVLLGGVAAGVLVVLLVFRIRTGHFPQFATKALKFAFAPRS